MTEFLTITAPEGLLLNVGLFTRRIIGECYNLEREMGYLDRPTTEPCCL